MVKAVCVLNGENVKGTIFFSQTVSTQPIDKYTTQP